MNQLLWNAQFTFVPGFINDNMCPIKLKHDENQGAKLQRSKEETHDNGEKMTVKDGFALNANEGRLSFI